jgi:hypothetical protein
LDAASFAAAKGGERLSTLHEQGRAVQEKMDAWGWEPFEVNMPARIFHAVQSLVTLTRMQSEEIERLNGRMEEVDAAASSHDVQGET